MPCASMVLLARAVPRKPMVAIRPVANADVAGVPGRTSAVNDVTVADDQVVWGGLGVEGSEGEEQSEGEERKAEKFRHKSQREL